MADSSLDDFFAKKDKSKKKTKSKTGDVDDGVKSTKKDKKRKDKDKQNSSTGATNALHGQQDDDEWKDFEEEKEADYTGLRIQTLQIAGKDDQDRDAADGDEDGDDEDRENRDRRDAASGPWNKSSSGTQGAPPSASHSEPVRDEAPAPKGPARYIPPAQRSQASSQSAASSRKKKEAPNVHSEEDFPTLGGGPGSGKSSSQQYRGTAASDLIDPTSQRKGVNLTLENKFSALQD